MRTLRKNKQRIYYSLLLGEEPIYLLDKDGNKIIDKVKDDGTILYKMNGRTNLIYSIPVEFYGNIAFGSGEVTEAEFGIDVSKYDAILVVSKNEVPITETSLLWFETEPTYKDDEKTVVDVSKADYKVLQVKPSLNQVKYVLGRLN